jgi:hypothetical protein
MRWAFNHDWTHYFVDSPDDPNCTWLAHMDLQAAAGADLFVVIPKAPLTVGCHVEIGARLITGREVHILREGGTGWHLFHSHPGVVEHKSFGDFALAIFGA